MQSFGAFYNDNRTLVIVSLVVAAAAVLLYAIYRLLFGRRLRMANSRTRQPRLGIVDAFDVDRQRQLVLIRRDNVEHLVMIGGPNDVLIESAIVRAQPSVAIPVGRDKDTAAAGGVAPAVSPGPAVLNGTLPTVAVAPAVDQRPPAPPDVTAVGAPEPPRADAPATPGGPVAEEILAAPSRPAYVPRTPFPARPGAATPATTRLSALRPPGTPLAPRPLATSPRPTPSAPLTRGTSAASLRREPVPGTPPASTALPVTPSQDGTPAGSAPGEAPGASSPPLPTPVDRFADQAEPLSPAADRPGQPPRPAPEPPRPLPTTLNTLESLEEEMAKLLGRPTAPSGKADG